MTINVFHFLRPAFLSSSASITLHLCSTILALFLALEYVMPTTLIKPCSYFSSKWASLPPILLAVLLILQRLLKVLLSPLVQVYLTIVNTWVNCEWAMNEGINKELIMCLGPSQPCWIAQVKIHTLDSCLIQIYTLLLKKQQQYRAADPGSKGIWTKGTNGTGTSTTM